MLPWLSVVFLVLVIIVPISLFIWFLFFTQIFNIQAVTVIDARPQTTEVIKEIIDNELRSNRWYTNIFLTPADAVEAKITSSLPQVRTVHINRKLPATLVAVVQEKTPALLLLSSGNYYFVDADGVAYEEARLDTLPGTVLPNVKNTDQSAEVTLGVKAIESSFVSLVQQVQEKLPEFVEAEVAEIHIPALGAREVYFLLNNNWELRFDSTRTAEAQLQVLKRVLEEAISLDEKKTLEYIDLRIPDRVYYRNRGATTTTKTSTAKQPASSPSPSPEAPKKLN